MTLAPIEPKEDQVSPEVFHQSITWAQQKAQKLKEIVDSQKLSVKIGPSEHLRVEGWQTIGKGYGYTCKTAVTELIRGGEGVIIGVKARATILDGNGLEVGGAESFCFGDEEGKKGQGVAQWAGMAQTRAESRAFKQILSWVVILAGYNPTPAEEMDRKVQSRRSQEADPMYLCPDHNVQWFKRGRMKAHAHPIEGESGPDGKALWCNARSDYKDGVLDKIDQLANAHCRRLGWDRNTLTANLETWVGDADWKTLNPQQKVDALAELEQTGVSV